MTQPTLVNGPLMNTYGRLPVTFDRGEGVWLFDQDGKRYLDAVSGVAVTALGHAHPAVTRAIQEQAGKLNTVAASGDVAAVRAQFGEVGKACKNCHDNFRTPED